MAQKIQTIRHEMSDEIEQKEAVIQNLRSMQEEKSIENAELSKLVQMLQEKLAENSFMLSNSENRAQEI